MNSKLIILVGLVALSSCSIMAVKKHTPHYLNTRQIKQLKLKYRISNVAGKKTDSKPKPGSPDPKAVPSGIERLLEGTSLQCRLTTFNMPANMTVQSYLKEAFEYELDAAEKLDPSSGKGIEAVVKSLDLDTSSTSKAYWSIDIDYIIGNKVYNISSKTEFESAFAAQTACTNAANNFSDAVVANFIDLTKRIEK